MQYLVASLSGPLYPYGTYFQRNYREGERIEVCDLPDWGWDDDDWEDKAKRKKLIENTPKRVPSDWISWKNHRLRKRGFYDPKNKRTHDVDKAAPRLVLRENRYPRNLSDLRPKSGFPSPGHLEFKIWLQNKIEDVALGRASPRFLHLEGRTREENESTAKWEELTTKIRGVLTEELLELTGPNNKLSTEVQHILLMHKIIGRKVGTINIHDPYWREKLKELTPEQTTKLMLQQQKNTPDLLDNICRQIVRLLIGKSKTTFPTRRKVYQIMASFDFSRLERHGAMAGQFLAVTPDEVKAFIEDDPLFWKAGKFNSQKFAEVLWVRNEKNPLHSETVQ